MSLETQELTAGHEDGESEQEESSEQWWLQPGERTGGVAAVTAAHQTCPGICSSVPTRGPVSLGS